MATVSHPSVHVRSYLSSYSHVSMLTMISAYILHKTITWRVFTQTAHCQGHIYLFMGDFMQTSDVLSNIQFRPFSKLISTPFSVLINSARPNERTSWNTKWCDSLWYALPHMLHTASIILWWSWEGPQALGRRGWSIPVTISNKQCSDVLMHSHIFMRLVVIT